MTAILDTGSPNLVYLFLVQPAEVIAMRVLSLFLSPFFGTPKAARGRATAATQFLPRLRRDAIKSRDRAQALETFYIKSLASLDGPTIGEIKCQRCGAFAETPHINPIASD